MTGVQTCALPIFLGLGVWHHIAVMRSAVGGGTIYTDGVLRASGVCGFPSGPLPSQPTLLGSRDDNYTGMGFQMDEVGFWNRELTAGEVTSLYNAGAGIQYPF